MEVTIKVILVVRGLYADADLYTVSVLDDPNYPSRVNVTSPHTVLSQGDIVKVRMPYSHELPRYRSAGRYPQIQVIM